jgi:hypothetical protein
MNRFRVATAMLCLLAAGCAPTMRADDFNHETHFTINRPLQIENTVLAPGQYTLKLTDLIANRLVVSIYNDDGTQLDAIVLGVTAYREDAGDQKLMTVSQPQGNEPGRLKTWFYPGNNYGVEFPVNNLPRELTYLTNSNGRVVRTKEKGPATGAAADASPGGRD